MENTVKSPTPALKPSPAMMKLQRAFIKSLGLPPETDVTGLEYSRHELWDSVAHMRLVSEIESSFDVMLESEEIIAMSSWGAAVALVRKHGVALDA
jgi:acyl carrier protein